VSAANLDLIMNDLGTQLGTITGLRVFAFPPKSAQPPFAFVNLPSVVAYDATMKRGADRFTTEVWVGVPDVVDRAATARLALLVAGSGSGSVKAAVEASTVYDHRVTEARFSQIVLAAGSYSGVIFQVDTVA
jgi:hypothetical protein